MRTRSVGIGSYLALSLAIVVFVGSLGVSVSRILTAEREFAGYVGETPVWGASENEGALLRFLDTLDRYGDGDDGVDHDQLLRDFDVLWSRLNLSREGEMARRLRDLPGVPEAIEAARDVLAELDPRIQALAPGAAAEAEAVAARLRPLASALHQAAIRVSHAEIARLAESRDALQAALLSALTYLLGLVASGALLVILLLVELRRRRRLVGLAQESEALARASEQRFRDIVEAASDWVWESDPDHRLSFVSGQLRQLSGEEPEDVLGRSRFDRRLPDDEDDANWEAHRALLDRRLPFRDFTFPYRDVEGRKRWSRIHGRPFFDSDGAFRGYRGTGRDITAEREARQALAESWELLRTVIDSVPALINVKDRESRYVLMNRFQGIVYGIDPAEAVGRLSAELTGPAYGGQSRAYDEQVLASGEALPFIEREMIDATGRTRVWWTSKQPLKDENGEVRYIVTVALDIGDLKAAEKARRNLARYFSPNMVELLAAKDEPIGQVRQQDVAVVFADLFDFSRFTARETPERMMAILRDLHARLTDIVLHHGGTLEKFLGDGLMATFGTPAGTGEDACKAIECIRDMALAMRQWNEERAAAGDDALRIGIGAHYGPVILGDIGNDRRVEFAVVGDTVNVANRLEALTRRLGTPAVLSEALVEAARREAGAEPACLQAFVEAGAEVVPGRDAPIRVWTLDLERLAPTRGGAPRPAVAAH